MTIEKLWFPEQLPAVGVLAVVPSSQDLQKVVPRGRRRARGGVPRGHGAPPVPRPLSLRGRRRLRGSCGRGGTGTQIRAPTAPVGVGTLLLLLGMLLLCVGKRLLPQAGEGGLLGTFGAFWNLLGKSDYS